MLNHTPERQRTRADPLSHTHLQTHTLTNYNQTHSHSNTHTHMLRPDWYPLTVFPHSLVFSSWLDRFTAQKYEIWYLFIMRLTENSNTSNTHTHTHTHRIQIKHTVMGDNGGRVCECVFVRETMRECVCVCKRERVSVCESSGWESGCWSTWTGSWTVKAQSVSPHSHMCRLI